jgi:hypothetical protein
LRHRLQYLRGSSEEGSSRHSPAEAEPDNTAARQQPSIKRAGANAFGTRNAIARHLTVLHNWNVKSFPAALVVAVFAAVSLPLSAQPAPQSNETGTVIYSVGSLEMAMDFLFRYKRVALPNGEAVSDNGGLIRLKRTGLWGPKMDVDFEGHDSGYVFVRSLPPGHYEIYDFGLSGSRGMSAVYTSSREKFAIPFDIQAGEATYIGSFARAPSFQGPMHRVAGAMGYFIVSDQSERDLPIARARHAELPADIRNAVFDVTALNHPIILTKEAKFDVEEFLRKRRAAQQKQ